jgi:hypothetical protein
MITNLLTDLQSLLHKTVATFVETFFGVWVVTDTSTVETAGASGLAAAVVVVKEWLSNKFGS